MRPAPSPSKQSTLSRVTTYTILRLSLLGCLLPNLGLLPPCRAQSTGDAMSQHFAAAQDSLRHGDQERAEREYKAFLGEAIHRVANARARAGDLSAAEESYVDALSFTGPDSDARLDYASVLFDQSRWNDAGSVAQSVVDVDPGDIRARVLLGRVFFEQKDYAAAKLQFEAALTHGALNEVWRLLSITYLRLQDLEHARSLLQRVITSLGDKPANHVAVAMTYYDGDYPDQAIAELKAELLRDPAAPAAHYDLGLAYLARNEEAGYPKAIPEFRAQLKLDPNDFPSRYMLAHIALKQRNFDEAELELKRAVALNAQDRSTQLLLGQLYSETHRAALAEDVLRTLIASSDPAEPDYQLVRAHYMLGRTLQLSGKVEDGTREIKEAERLRKQVRLTVAETSASRVQSQVAMESESVHSGQPRATAQEKAQAHAFVSRIGPAIAESYYNLGKIASLRNDSGVAAQYLQKAIEWDPSLAPKP